MGLMGGGKGGGKNALASKPNLLNALRVQTSSYGQVIPIVYGQNRVSGRLLWSGDFAAIPHTSTQKVGGKGLGSGGGNAITNTTYTYQTAVAMGLCMGPIQNIHNVWDTKGRLTLITATVPFTVPGAGGGTSIVPPGIGIFHSHKGVGRADAYNFLQNDFGSDGATTFSGTQQTPMTQVGSSPATGQYLQITSASPTTMSGATNASPIVITNTAHGYFTGQQVTISGVLGNTAANGTWTITVTDANHFSLNGSIGTGAYTSGGQALLVVPSFVFASGDAGKVMTITYVYSVPDSNSNGQPQQKLNLTLFTGARPQTPWSYLTSKHSGQDLGYNGIAYVASSAMDLGESGTLPNLSFEVLGVLPFNGGITDAEPSAVIADLITNQYYGLAGALPLGDLTQYRNFCTANGIFISPVLDAQKAASAWIQEILDITNSAAVWSEGVLKIVPYGDTTAVGNGATFIPNTSPVYDLTTSDLLVEVTVKRPSIADVMNSVSVEFVNRANDYNVDVAEDKDDAMIAVYGLRKDQPMQAHSVTTTAVAKKVANFLRKRQVEIRATYTLTLGWQFNLLEPMDLVTLTIPELGYNKKPVRITAIRENDNGQLEMDAEDFPFGTASATLYPQQGPGGFVPQANADPGSVNPPVVFEAPFLMSQTGQHEIWMAVSGGSLGNLLLYSEQFDNTAFWALSNATVTPNATTDPLGGQTADAIAYSVAGTGAYIFQTVTPSVPVANQPFTFSCWVKTPSGTNSINLLIEDQSGAVIVNTTFAINSTWQRFSVTGTMRSSSTAVTVFVYNPLSAGTFHLWGAQLENSSSMNPYNQTTSLPVRVANPNWGGCHVWISQDNSEYQQIGQVYGPSRMGVLTGTITSRTNLLSFSEQFDNAVWDKDGGSTITANNALAPNTTGTADTFTKGGGTFVAWAQLEQHFNGNMSGQTWTFSIWLRVTSGTLSGVMLGLSDVILLSKFSASQTVTTTWQRFSFTASGFNNTGSIGGGVIVPGAAGTQIQVWGAQLEQSAAATPYIPTTTPLNVTSLVNSGTDPDPTNYFPVDLTQSAGALQSGTQADADSYRSLCYAGGEFIAFQGTALSGSNKYNVGQDGSGNVYLRRALFGSNITAHNPGEMFARLDNSIFTYVYDPSFIGKTLYLKFTSFNTSGLMEQSIANATAYQFIVTGKYCQMETVSKNLLANPGFEYNVAGTPVSTYPNVIPISSGQRFGDSWSAWNGSAVATAGDAYLTVDLETSSPRTSGRSALLLNVPGAVLPNDSRYYTQGVISDKVAVTPGESYCVGGWIRTVVDGSLPSGVSWWGAIRAILYDASGAVLGQIWFNGAQSGPGLGTGNPDPGFSGPFSGGVFNGGYTLQSTYFTVPATLGTGKPAYAALWCTGLLQNAGAAAWTMSGLQIDCRFDDCFFFPQWSAAGDEIGKQGSISNTYTGALNYVSNTNSITWSWNLSARRTDTALSINNYAGSQVVTGLSASTSYNFYPFIDEVNQVVSMVATGGVGSPTWAHNGTSIAWTQEQTRGDHFPLSSAPVPGATTATGTGGGGGGGIGGSCLRYDTRVHERSKGLIAVRDLEVGDWVNCPRDEDTPEGWVEVIAVDKSHISREWVHTFFNVEDWLATTPGHPFTLEDGCMKRAAQLNLEDAIPCSTGITYPVNHALETYCASKVSITVRSSRHVFYAGMKSPCVLQHNFMPQS